MRVCVRSQKKIGTIIDLKKNKKERRETTNENSQYIVYIRPIAETTNNKCENSSFYYTLFPRCCCAVVLFRLFCVFFHLLLRSTSKTYESACVKNWSRPIWKVEKSEWELLGWDEWGINVVEREKTTTAMKSEDCVCVCIVIIKQYCMRKTVYICIIIICR